SPFVCGAEAAPRLCDPPCSEEQAGIGPISQKPKLLTLDIMLVTLDQMRKMRPAVYPNHRSKFNSAGRPNDTYTIAFCRKRRPMEAACARDKPNARTLASGGH